MTTTADSRIGALEGRADEQASAIADLRADIQDVRRDLHEGVATVTEELHDGLVAVNARVDRLFLAVLTVGAGVGVAQVGLLVTLILRT